MPADYNREMGCAMTIGQQLARRMVSSACYWMCERLDARTDRRTTCTKLVAGEAIAAVRTLNLDRALAETEMPRSAGGAIATFSPAEWREVLAHAANEMQFIERELARPEWAHLRSHDARSMRCCGSV